MKLNFANFIFVDRTDRKNPENFMTVKISSPTVVLQTIALKQGEDNSDPFTNLEDKEELESNEIAVEDTLTVLQTTKLHILLLYEYMLPSKKYPLINASLCLPSEKIKRHSVYC